MGVVGLPSWLHRVPPQCLLHPIQDGIQVFTVLVHRQHRFPLHQAFQIHTAPGSKGQGISHLPGPVDGGRVVRGHTGQRHLHNLFLALGGADRENHPSALVRRLLLHRLLQGGLSLLLCQSPHVHPADGNIGINSPSSGHAAQNAVCHHKDGRHQTAQQENLFSGIRFCLLQMGFRRMGLVHGSSPFPAHRALGAACFYLTQHVLPRD